MPKIAVRQPADKADEVPTEVLATSIVAISQGIRKLRAGRLSDRALFLLIQDAAPGVGGRNNSQIPMKDIKAVLAGIENLEAMYIRKKKPGGV